MEKRRFTDKIRALADLAWDRGDKETSTDLHQVATVAEKKRKDWCNCGAKTPQAMFHKPGCPHRERLIK